MRIYAYGARPPVENANLVFQQFRLACTYQRVLVLTERRRRTTVEALYRHACPVEWAAYDAAVKEVIAAIDAVRVLRSRPGDMLEPDEEMKAENKEIARAAKERLARSRETEIVTRQAWKTARKKATPRLKPRLAMCDRGARARNKFAYNRAGDVGLAWGTRLKVAESAERAAKMSAKEGSMPHLPKFDGGGMVSVQLQGDSGFDDIKGLLPADAFGGKDTRFRLEIVDAARWQAAQGRSSLVGKNGRALDQPSASGRRSKRTYALVHLRVGSSGRAPIWATWPAILHRAMPERPIKWVSVLARKVGAKTEWSLLVTVDDELPTVKPKGETLAVNLGWRNLKDGGLRVGYAVGTDGHEEEVRVPETYATGVAKVNSIRSIRDKHFELAKAALKSFIEDGVPEWLATAARYVDQWRSQKRLALVLINWRERRFDGDEKMWSALSEWWKKDKHLRLWECHERDGLLKMRLDFYRVTAAKWAVRYSKIVVTDMDLRDFAELPDPAEAADSEGREQRSSRMLAAPSELRGAIKNACSTRGTAFEEVDGKYKTQTCNACGVVFAFAARTDLEHTCKCGVRWDQDSNHCKNLLASGEVVRGGGGSLAPSVNAKKDEPEEKNGRWQKRRSQTETTIIEKTKQFG